MTTVRAPEPVIAPTAHQPVPPPPPSRSTVGSVDNLHALVRQRRLLDQRLAQAVMDARDAGATWTSLARALGVSPQAVQKRYAKRAT